MQFLSDAGYERLASHRTRAGGAEGRAWVDSLDSLIANIARRWELEVQPHFDNLSYNYVAPVQKDGVPAVLKLCPPDNDFLCEAELLIALDGRGCVRLLDVDRAAGAMLLERLQPGIEVHTLNHDVAETSAVAGVMRELQRPYAGLFPFPNAREWINDALAPEAIPKLKVQYPWIGRALGRLVELAGEPYQELLLHGDLHHQNVLSGRGDRWVAIDGHGVIGDPAWELAPFLFNYLPRYPRADWRAVVRRRADQFAEELELDRERVYAWSAVRAIQSACWSLHDETTFTGSVFEGSIVCAQALTEL